MSSMHIATMAPDLRVWDFEAGKTDVSDSRHVCGLVSVH